MLDSQVVDQARRLVNTLIERVPHTQAADHQAMQALCERLDFADRTLAEFSAALPPAPETARVIPRPRKGSGRVTLKLCRPDGTAGEVLISRRDRDLFKQARRADWGDSL